jgi:UDP-2-acetamido-3-amino-2,3-dideoxy-glucuronate N-acetyltransferase
LDGPIPVPNKAKPESIDIAEQEPILAECRHFLECVATGKHPKTNAHEGLRVLKILNLSQLSLDNYSKKYHI